MTSIAAARCRVLNGRPVLIVRHDTSWYLHDGRTISISREEGERFIDDLPVYRIRDIYDPHFPIANRLKHEVNAQLDVSIQVIWDAPPHQPDWMLPFNLFIVWPLSFVAYCFWLIGVFFIPGVSEVGERVSEARDKPRAGMNPWLDATYAVPQPTRTTDEWYGFISGS